MKKRDHHDSFFVLNIYLYSHRLSVVFERKCIFGWFSKEQDHIVSDSSLSFSQVCGEVKLIVETNIVLLWC